MTEASEDQLDEMLDELAGLDEEDARVLAEAWQQEDEAPRRRAWAKASQHIERAGLTKALDRARSEVGRWAAAGRSEFAGIDGLLGRPSESASSRYAAAPAALDMAAAILAGDALDEEDAAVLTGPWRALDDDAESPVDADGWTSR